MLKSYADASLELKKFSSPEKAINAQRFFKTAPGQYGHGDIFIGVTVPETRSVARRCGLLSLTEIAKFLKSPIHEERLLGLLVLVDRYRKCKDIAEREKLLAFYLKHKNAVNNWDLVDSSAAPILGAFCLETGDPSPMQKLLTSKRHWDRRMAMIATLTFIRAGKTRVAFDYAKALLSDQEDLMHKASGWMLREAGKKDLVGLKLFLKKHGQNMPRTMLRYAIEKFPEAERKRLLLESR